MGLASIVLLVLVVAITGFLLHELMVVTGNDSRTAWLSILACVAVGITGLWAVKQSRADWRWIHIDYILLFGEVVVGGLLILLFGRWRSDPVRDKRVVAWLALAVPILMFVFNIVGGAVSIRNNGEPDCEMRRVGTRVEVLPKGC